MNLHDNKLNLLCLSLQRASAISCAIYGNFSGPKQQELVVAKGNIIELLRPDDTGKVISICSTPVFSTVRSIHPLRLSGANKDYVVIGSDSGKISIMEYDTKSNSWKLVHCEVFGKTGCRRIVPGQYLAVDPKGRAVLIAGIEKQKFVYIMNRDSNNKLTISSPLEAHKAETILFSVVGVDVGFDNPVFAMIELEYTESDQDPTGEAFMEVEKKLIYYELDLGLNHVVRRWAEPVSRTANFLLSVPGGDTWPSGVLLCGENWVSYKHQGHVEVRTALPRRNGLPLERGVLITAGTVHKQKGLFFFLLQSEYGDLYKVTLDLDPNDCKIVQNVVVTVFDTIQPCNSLCITRTGLLFGASEFGNHALFQFQGIEDPLAVRNEKVMDEELNEELGDDSFSAARVAPLFTPSTKLRNLLLIDDVESLAPITDTVVGDLAGEGAPQIYSLCGRGCRSTLRVLRRGVSVAEVAVSELPGRPLAVWTVKESIDSEFDKYIVVTFSNATLVLSIGDNVEEVTDSGFLTTSPTLQVALLADGAMIQVHSSGIRHIRPDQRTSEWKTPERRVIQLASANSRQVAISLSGGEVTYFELDAAGQLIEMGSVEMGKEVSSLDLGVVPAGRARSPFLAIGCWDDSVQLLSLDPNEILSKASSFSADARPTSLCLVEMAKEEERAATNTSAATDASSSTTTTGLTLSVLTSLYLNVGLENGVLLRLAVDPVTGDFSDARQKFLGSKAVKLCRTSVQGQSSVMALSQRPWLLYNYQNRYMQDPLSYDALEHAADFSSEICPDGMVAVIGNTLRIFTITNLGSLFNQTSIALRYTPRKMCSITSTGEIAIIESDHNEYNEEEKKALEMAAMASSGQKDAKNTAMEVSTTTNGAAAHSTDETVAEMSTQNGENTTAMITTEENSKNGSNGHNNSSAEAIEGEEEEEAGTLIPVRGPLPPSDGKWASCIRILHPATGETKGILELQRNEAAFSLCTCRFSQHSEETFIVVGTCRDLKLHPKSWSACYLNVYRLLDGTLQLLHQTELEDLPLAITEFQGKLLVGAGRVLRLFDLGKKKLLKKCENRLFPTAIVRLQTLGDRIYVGDMAESIHFVHYRRTDNVLNIFADETFPRFVTGLCVLDYQSVAACDKFGNVFLLRLPADVTEDSSLGGSSKLLWEQGVLNGAPQKAECVACYYLGEAATAISRSVLKPHGKEVLLVSTITGGLHALVPFQSERETGFFQHLEMFMRQEYTTNICQRDHLSYRSYFQPAKNTIDGDLCEGFVTLSYAKQKEFSEDLDRSPADVIKKIEEMRDFV